MSLWYDADGPGIATYDSSFAYYDLPEVSALVTVMKTVINADGLPPGVIVTKAQSIHDQLVGNPNYPNTNPSLANFQAAITTANDALVNADAKTAAAKEAVAASRAATKALLVVLRLMAAHVENASGGITEKILSSGFSVRAANNGSNPKAAEAVISILSLTPTNNDGELRLRIKPFPYGLYYEVYTTITPENAESWVLRKTDSRATMMLTGFAGGTKVSVRVRAKLRDGFTGFSAEVGRKIA